MSVVELTIMTTTTVPAESIWSTATAGEIALLIAGAVFTVAIVLFFVILMLKAPKQP